MTTTLSAQSLTRLAVSLLCAGLLFDCTANAITVVECEVDSDCGAGRICNSSHSCTANVGATSISSGLDYCDAAVSTACTACASTECSQPEQNGCLADSKCRGAINGYASCLGGECGGTPAECFAPLSAPGSTIPSCLAGCSDACAQSPIYSECQLYCGCMGSNCATQFGSMDDCITECQALPSNLRACRWTHCELAGIYPLEAHCDHAIGIGFCGLAEPQVRPAACRDKRLDGSACQQDSDCCSNHCDSRRSCADP
jgi:hypothetical protein